MLVDIRTEFSVITTAESGA